MAHILIIDDDRTVQILLTRTLQRSGYDVTIAPDGVVGLKLAEKIRPALIICDWLMPGISGLEVCLKVKDNAHLSTTFFILLTSRVAVEDKIQGLDAGADDFICKPIDLQELKARVRAGLRLHDLSEDLKRQKRLLENEFTEAAEYVSSILPKPITHPQLKIDFRFIPSRQLGGDIFDYFFLDQDNLVFYLLDISGHGLGAALPSISILNLLRSGDLGKINYQQPDQVLFSLNNFFDVINKDDKYFTIWYGIYHLRTRQLTFSSGGHPPAIYVDHQSSQPSITKLKTQGMPIGMFPNIMYVNSTYQIQPSSSLYLFSDGIYEILNQKKEMWGIDNFIKLFETKSDLDDILIEVTQHNPGRYFPDDLSIMQIKFL